MCLPSCRPKFESQAHHVRFYQFKFEFLIVTRGNDENKQKEAVFGTFLIFFIKNNPFSIQSWDLNSRPLN